MESLARSWLANLLTKIIELWIDRQFSDFLREPTASIAWSGQRPTEAQKAEIIANRIRDEGI